MRKAILALLVAVTLAFSGIVKAGLAEDEKAIKALNDVFAEGFVKRDAKLRASIWTKDSGDASRPDHWRAKDRAAKRQSGES